eukprot:Colp12_sorted_trinity150504_noHs@1473
MLEIISSIFSAPVLVTVTVILGTLKLLQPKPTIRKMKFGVPVSEEDGAPYRNAKYVDSLATHPVADVHSMGELFEYAVNKYANNNCFGTRDVLKEELVFNEKLQKNFEKLTLGEYRWLNYSQVKERVDNLRSGLVAHGIQPGDNVAIFAETRAEWLIALQACFAAKFVVVTVYATLGEEALISALNESEIQYLVTDGKLLKTVKNISKKISTLKVVVYTEPGEAKDVDALKGSLTVESFAEVEAAGKAKPVPAAKCTEEDLALIMYTSGSTAAPKGVMMSHGNLLSCVAGLVKAIPNLSSEDVYLGYLPLAHVLELSAECVFLFVGGSIGYGSPFTLTDASPKVKAGTQGDASVLRPTLMAAVPAIMDRIRHTVLERVNQGGGLKKYLFNTAFAQKLAAIRSGSDTPFWNWLVFKKAQAPLGGRVRLMLSGGAPLSVDTQEFMNVVFCPVGQGYGLTETCGGITVTDINDRIAGRVGCPVSSAEIKLVDWAEGGYLVADKHNPAIGKPRGEIAISGGIITKGYYKNKEKTDEAYIVENGKLWFYTGDVGQFHADGVLEIIDRKKDLTKLQNGEYISLGKIEAILKGCPLIDNICIYADGFHSYCIALAVPNHIRVERFCQAQGIDTSNWEAAIKDPRVNKEILSGLQAVAKDTKLSRVETPTKVIVVKEEWLPETNLVTAALKLRREQIKKFYEKEIMEAYPLE